MIRQANNCFTFYLVAYSLAIHKHYLSTANLFYLEDTKKTRRLNYAK